MDIAEPNHTIINPQITVFIAAYNAELYIDEAIKSILNQSFQDFELLIVNDGSTDNTSNILQSYNDNRIKVIDNEMNKGQIFSRNIALKQAKGKYLAVLDSDDIALPHRLALQYKTMEQRPLLALIGGQALVIDQNGIKTKEKMTSVVGSTNAKAALFFENHFIHPSVMMRLDVFKQIGGYPDLRLPFAEDYWLFSHIAKEYEIDNLPENLILYRKHGQNVTATKNKEIQEMLLTIKEDQLNFLGIDSNEIYLAILMNHPANTDITVDQYFDFYEKLILQNRLLQKIPIVPFEKRIYNDWFEVLRHRNRAADFGYLLKKPLFKMEYVKMKHVRRAIKFKLKSLLNIEK